MESKYDYLRIILEITHVSRHGITLEIISYRIVTETDCILPHPKYLVGEKVSDELVLYSR